MIRRFLVLMVAAGLGATTLGAVPPAATAAAAQDGRVVPGAGLPRPRAVFTPGSEADLAARLEREPYRSIFLDAHALHEARRLSRTPGDPDRNAQKDMARAARFLAFAYALDRTVINGEIVPFPDDATRRAAGEIVEELLLGLFNRSRFAVPPPIGGWDRDIDTAGEILQWSGAFDTMLGAGYDFGGNDRTIADLLIDLTSELYRNYTDPATAGGVANLHQNNHRSKSGAAMATAAVVLAEYAPGAADDPDGSRDPLKWWDYGTTQVDEALRHILVTGDGAYSEGPHYQRFTTETMAPFFGMWDRILGDDGWTTADGRRIPAIHTTAQFGLTQDWMLALTLPDGTLAPIDDSNTDEAHYFGALPVLPNRAAYAWRWATAEPAFVWEASTDLAVDSIVAFDDTIVPAPPAGSPTSFWYEGGNAVFRSDWSPDATMVIAQGEGITASLFGRDSTGAGRSPQSHEHIEPGSYLLYAEGSMLVLDPGYLSFGAHGQVLEARDHNMVLVDGVGPEAMLANSLDWLSDPYGPPPQDGFASIHSTLDTDRLDSAVVTTRYGGETDIELHRRFLFVDNRYLVIADEITPDGTGPVELDWLVHGNGGGSSGGTYVAGGDGGTWTQGGARLTTAIATSVGAPTITSRIEEHESPTDRGLALTHEVQYASVDATGPVHAVQVLIPSSLSDTAPTIATGTDADGAVVVTIDDPAAGRTATVSWVGEDLALLDVSSDAGDPIAFATTDHVSAGSVDLRAPGASAVGLSAIDRGGWEVIADDPAHSLYLDGVGPGHLDGACAAFGTGSQVRIDPSGSIRSRWVADPLDARPGAVVAAAPSRVGVGTRVPLDGRRSCDPAGDDLTPSWELVSAPRGSSWVLDGTDGWTPTLSVDATGTFRVRLTVTDEAGNVSDPVEVVIAGGDRCGDERDDDLDGLFDAADPDCDGPEPEPAVDAIGFITDTSYIGAIETSPDRADVRRDPSGAIDSIAMTAVEGSRVMAAYLHTGHDPERATGLVVLIDPDSGLFRIRFWNGRIIEIRPGVIGGIDDAASMIWIVVDERS
ncbi:MAG: heparinase II/III family protein [Acidimicrobiales bacterium]